MITLTEIAIDKVKELAESDKLVYLLRTVIKGGGCSGFLYDLYYEEKEPTEQDLIFKFDGVHLICDMWSHLYLDGVTIDYIDNLAGSGFKFINPGASQSCGCGSSFTP